MERLKIFDTTLRDGEQSPGAAMKLEQKLAIAHALAELKVDIIEAGFPVSSTGDFKAVNQIAKEVKGPIICGLARCHTKDIDAARDALKANEQFRIHVFIATSPIHMQKKLNMIPQEVIERAVQSVKYARQFTDDVEFSTEDGGRSDNDFLCDILEQVIKAGATTLNIPDTVGYNLPHQYGHRIRHLIENIPNSDKAIFSTHCHDDLGLAVANSLAGVLNGARQIECSINGLGERAGNAALEEVVMAVRTHADEFGCDTQIYTPNLVKTSKLVADTVKFPVAPNKAIVGKNAFAHESGIHQDGVLKHRETYEIMQAQDVGWESNQIVLGKLSGRNALKARLEALDIILNVDELKQIFVKFKALADHQTVTDEDLIQLKNQL